MIAAPLRTLMLLLALTGVPVSPMAMAATGRMANPQAADVPAELRPILYQSMLGDAGPGQAVGKNGCATLLQPSLTACFKETGAHFSGTDAPALSLRLDAIGRGRELRKIAPAKPQFAGSRVSYAHAGFTEWWRVLPVGFEQGFTLDQRPAGNGELVLALDTSRAARSRGDGLAWGSLRYSGLVVTDADGKTVPATLKSEGRRILITADDANASYPLTVDPLVWLEQKVVASDGAYRDYLGTGFAMAGDTALAGAPYARIGSDTSVRNHGAVYVFTKTKGVWTQTQKLTASDVAPNAYFGEAIALQGDTAIVGADGVAVNGANAVGAAYVFTRATDGTWSQTQKLTPSDGTTTDGFGLKIAIDGSTALVCASYATINGNGQQGKVYVYKESDSGVWSEAQQLLAADGAAYAYFGKAMAIQGDTLLIGSNGNSDNQGAVYVFSESNGSWSQVQRLAASDSTSGGFFGSSVALSGSAALVGATSMAVNGNVAAGAAYVFTETGGEWAQTQKLTAGDGNSYAQFGVSVALLGPTALIGAPYATVNGNANQGAAYVFTESNGVWAQTDKLTASDGALNNWYGWKVAFDGVSAGISSIGAGPNALQGAIYLYARSGAEPHTVVPTIIGSGTITPDGPQAVDDTATISFTLTPEADYRIDGVGGTCAGTLAGDIYTTVPITADCTVEIRFGLIQQMVTPSVAGGHGTITPDAPQTVGYGDTLTFTLTADADYVPDVVAGSCGGTLAGNTFTTAAVTADCTVIASFRSAQHTVTPSVIGANGAISPNTPQTVDDSTTPMFTLTPDPGYMVDTVGGSCGGTLSGDTYTTAPVTADCTVEVSYTTAHYTVTPSLLTGHGTIAPGLPQSAGYGDVLVFTAVADDGYAASIGGTCGGTLSGNTYTTAPIIASCTVEASFVPAPTHTVTPSVSGGHGAITPATPQTVVDGSTLVFNLVSDSGYVVDAVDGSCGGTLSGTTYTTAPVTADCTVEVSFTTSPDVIFANGFD